MQVSDADDRHRSELGREIFAAGRRDAATGGLGTSQQAGARRLPRRPLRHRPSAVPPALSAAAALSRQRAPAGLFPSRAGAVSATAEFRFASARFHIATRRPEVRAQAAVRSLVRSQTDVVRLLSAAAAVDNTVPEQRRVDHVSIYIYMYVLRYK